MANTTGDYSVNYEDERFKTVETEKANALSGVEETYSGMIDQSQSYFDKQSQAVKDWGGTQSQLQQEQTDFAIGQIEQQKDQAEKDYKKEQSGAYVDWQKQSNQYGANKEAEAMQGMSNTGYSESSQVGMYNAYQNRAATARESFTRASLNFDNAIKDARLQSNSALAEIAYQTLQTQLELALQGFQYKNSLLLDLSNKKLEVDQMYHNRWQDVLAQINQENALAEEVRQFNFYNKLGEFAEVDSSSGSSGGGAGTISYNTWLANMSKKDRAAYEASLNAGKITGPPPVTDGSGNVNNSALKAENLYEKNNK